MNIVMYYTNKLRRMWGFYKQSHCLMDRSYYRCTMRGYIKRIREAQDVETME